MQIFKNEAEYLASLPDKCKACGGSGCDDYAAPYWQYDIETVQGVCKPKGRVHKACKAEYVSITAYECQKIDADCNDCKHFLRGVYLGNDIFDGMCKKFDKSVKAYPNFCSNHPCFEHRKD